MRNLADIQKGHDTLIAGLPRNKDGVQTLFIKDMPQLHRDRFYLLRLIKRYQRMAEYRIKTFEARVEDLEKENEDLRAELAGEDW